MIRNRTVFVVGAGASMPYGFPSGPQLRHEIVSETLMPGDPRHKFLMEIGHTYEQVEDCRIALARSWASSIDMFIATRSDHESVARSAIALTIARYERDDELFFAEPNQDWFRFLWRRIHGRRPEAFPTETISFITFNYDRTLEHALYNGLQHAYGKEVQDVGRRMPKIIHVYGSLGGYPGLAPTDAWVRPFASKTDRENTVLSTKEIKVISEGDHGAEHLVEARRLLSEATLVVFLGFGYDEDNLRILKLHSPGSCLLGGCTVLGTAMHLERAERELAKSLVSGRSVQTQGMTILGDPDCDCLTFLRQRAHFLH